MKQLRQWIVMLCGLLMVAQGIASAASFPPLTQSASSGGQQVMAMAHCHGMMHQQGGTKARCCMDQCADMASCSSPAALAQTLSLNLDFAPPLAPPPHRSGGFVSPDPDTRLRPPTSLLS